MKSVLLSIRPKWCWLIANGKKTIEVRKTRPKIETPFKCYIYCQEGKPLVAHSIDEKLYAVNGKVIGEFVCDNIVNLFAENHLWLSKEDVLHTCLTADEIREYGNGASGLYGWHISDLKLYDELKELKSFWKADKCPYATKSGCTYKYHCFRAGQTQRCGETLTRPPLSWCYVEELQ